MGVAHIALDLRARNESRNGVDNYNVDSARTGQRFGYLERLLAVIRLRDKESIDVNAEIRGVYGVKRVLGVNERASPPILCASATTWRASVVLPDDSGPYISIILPRGSPPIPVAASRVTEPVDIASTFIAVF